MRETVALILLLLFLVGAAGFVLWRWHRARLEREYRRGHSDYSKVKRPGGLFGW